VDRLGVRVGHGGPGSVASGVGDALGDALVWPDRVVVDLVLAQDGAQVRRAEDQHAVEEFAAQGAGEASAGRGPARSLEGGAHDPGAGGLEDGVGERVKFDPRSRIRNLMSSDRSPRLRARLRACCTVHSPAGRAETPPRRIRRVPCPVNTRTYSLFSSTVPA